MNGIMPEFAERKEEEEDCLVPESAWQNVRVERAIKHWRATKKEGALSRKSKAGFSLRRQLVEIQIQNKPFRVSEAFSYHRAREVVTHEGKFLPCVIKLKRQRSMLSPDWFAMCSTQMAAYDWAEKFNAQISPRYRRLAFPECAVLELAEREHVFCKADFVLRTEPAWPKRELKTVTEAFSHMLYHKSGHSLVSGRLFTDQVFGHFLEPEIHSLHARGEDSIYGARDRGEESFYNFINSHRCNRLCNHLAIPKIEDRTFEALSVGKVFQERKNNKILQPEDAQKFRTLRQLLNAVYHLSILDDGSGDAVSIDLYLFPSLTDLRIDKVRVSRFIIPPYIPFTLQRLDAIAAVDSLGTLLQPVYSPPRKRVGTIEEPTSWERLKKLTVSHSKLEYTDCCLKHLPALAKLNLSHNKIEVIRNIQECVSMRELDLRNNAIESLKNINVEVGNVSIIRLTANVITDPSPLAKLFGLKLIDLSYNLISDVELLRPLTKLPYLTQLWLKGNPLSFDKMYRIHVITVLLPIFDDPERVAFDLDAEPVTMEEIRVARKNVNYNRDKVMTPVVEPPVEEIAFQYRNESPLLPTGVLRGTDLPKRIKPTRRRRFTVNTEKPKKQRRLTSHDDSFLKGYRCQELDELDRSFESAISFVTKNREQMLPETHTRLRTLYKQATLGDCPADFRDDKLWQQFSGMDQVDAKRLYVNTVDDFQPEWRFWREEFKEPAPNMTPPAIPDLHFFDDLHQVPKRTLFNQQKTKHSQTSMDTLWREFGVDLMDTFSFMCSCSYGAFIQDRPEQPSEFLVVVSRLAIHEKDPRTQTTRFKRSVVDITKFETYECVIKVFFADSDFVRYTFGDKQQIHLFEHKLATAMLNESAYKLLDDGRGDSKGDPSRDDLVATPRRRSKLSAAIHKRRQSGQVTVGSAPTPSGGLSQEPGLLSPSFDAMLSPPVVFEKPESSVGSGTPRYPYLYGSVDESIMSHPISQFTDFSNPLSHYSGDAAVTPTAREENTASKAELTDALKRFWLQRKLGETKKEFERHYVCRRVRITTKGAIGERSVILLLWRDHLFVLTAKGKHEGNTPQTLFLSHASKLQRVQIGFQGQYFTLDFSRKSLTFVTRDEFTTHEICTRLRRSQEKLSFGAHLCLENHNTETLKRIESEITEVLTSVILYAFVLAPIRSKTKKSFVRGGVAVVPQTIIMTDEFIYLCDEDYHFIMNPKNLKDPETLSRKRFCVLEKRRTLSVVSCRAGDFQRQGFYIEFDDGGASWKLISQKASSEILSRIRGEVQKLRYNVSTESSVKAVDSGDFLEANLERVVVELP